jgi:NADP-dependent 3-hydroxy acid dehydrogenase YdfG
MSTSLAGKWVLITGASSGFGAASARHFGTQGANLLLGARRLDRLKRVAEDAMISGAKSAHYSTLDVTKNSSVKAFVEWSATHTAHLDILINNAGGAVGLESVAEGRDEDWETMLQTNVLGLLRMTRASLPMLLKSKGASILNIGSLAGRVAYEGGSVYGAAKAAALQVTKVLRLELNGTGIRVCSIDPGLAQSEFSLVRFRGDATRAAKVYEGTEPLTPDDIAETLVWVASRPPHVNIDELLIKPTDQAAMHKIYRRPKSDS